MKDIVVIGAGGVGKETALIIEQINLVSPTWNLIGFLDDDLQLQGKFINGYRVLGGIDYIDKLENIYAICAIASYKAKKAIVDRVMQFGIKFANVIHPSVQISSTNSIGEDVIIYPGVIVTTNINIGNHVILSPGCGIGHETEIDDFNSLLWNVNISGNVKIGTGCLLGTGSKVIQNISIGHETIVGAGAVVIRDLLGRCTVVGVPARIIKKSD